MTAKSTLAITIGGELSPDNNASLRTLGTITQNIQLALNRAYLDVKNNGKVLKNERVRPDDYCNIDFWLDDRRKGSLVVDFISTTEWGEKITNRFTEIVQPAFNLITKGIDKEIYSPKEAHAFAKNSLKSKKIDKTFVELCQNPPKGYSDSYAQKALLRSVNSSITPIRANNSDGIISFDTTTPSKGTTSFVFNKTNAAALQKLVRRSSFLSPVIYHGEIIATNRKLSNATFKNYDANGNEQKLIFLNEQDFEQANTIYARGTDIKFYGMPKVESSSLDLQAGDVLFVGLV